MEFLEYYFDMFDSLLKSEFDNKYTTNFEDKINEYREKLKDTFDNEAQNFTQFCHMVDKFFNEYLESKKL